MYVHYFYFSLGIRPDITWAITKLSKTCMDPEDKYYEDFLCTLVHLRKHQYYAIKYYSEYNDSPIHNIFNDNDIRMSEITSFSYSTWKDFPDTGRSTIVYKISCKVE